jgi:hypothetical protein
MMNLNYRQICRPYYTLEMLSSDLFTYNIRSQRDVLCQEFADTYSDFFPNLNIHSS